ncbi:MAG: DUF4936 domain-containing protein [Thiobacillus sp. 63-78]|uniref:DUF4936 family protein n=1 Tax=Thiobacillus sp. 63-78 TaxID=1895859 RepID=UPI00086A5439|nr:DUF4936 family protein [Thiobacillus sp. 63-78]MBN8762251.1 DUF4936 family protein [Thiobacillus sp.]ODV13849.1 MAG: DUF4936 domain-containing protein [Thiobacillus sp. SCN 64-317]MBN8766877.1 DUF4936 family protein [Thiobacillus sp.]MBN8774651.1 DUF4936 family protein [Thiobacillus sp.]OJZ12857.1 MAG: DUF4936 domain-containing protein [Thiobacillus sp. 63-78]
MRHAYVYYRIDPAQARLAALRGDALLDALTRYCSQPPRRLRRCDDPSTWMEIYEGITDFAAFSAALERAVLELGCIGTTVGERHLECFLAPDPAPEG